LGFIGYREAWVCGATSFNLTWDSGYFCIAFYPYAVRIITYPLSASRHLNAILLIQCLILVSCPTLNVNAFFETELHSCTQSTKYFLFSNHPGAQVLMAFQCMFMTLKQFFSLRSHFCHGVLVAFIVIISALSSLASATNLPTQISFQNILENNDIALGEVSAIFQDSEGYLWFGGENALLRYDGYEAREIRPDTTDVAPYEKTAVKFVTDIIEDSHRNLWIATRDGLFQFNPYQEKLVKIKDDDNQTIKISISNIRQVIELSSGEILAGSVSGLFVVDSISQRYSVIVPDVTKKNWLQSSRVNTALIDGNNIWLGTEAGLEKVDWQTKTFSLYKPYAEKPDLVPDNRVMDIVADGQGKFWLATSNGLVHFDPQTQQAIRYRNDPKNPFSIGSNDLWRLLLDSQGTLWVASDGGGVSVFNKENNRFINHKFEAGRIGSIGSNQIRTVFEDKVGDIWVGTYPVGINFFDRSSAPIITYTNDSSNRNSLSHNVVLSVAEDKKGNLWIGTDGGGLNYLNRDTGEFTHFKSDPNDVSTISGNAVLATYIDSTGLIWNGTWGGGISSYNPTKKIFTRYPFTMQRENAERIRTSAALNNSYIWDIREDKNKDIWITTHFGGISKYNRKTKLFTHYMHVENDPESLTGNLVWSTFEDSQGNFWVGANSGLNLMNREKGTFTHYVKDPNDPTSLSNSSVLVIFEDSKQRLWLGTDAGLNLFNSAMQSFTVYNKKNGLTDDTIRNILEDSEGNLWLSTNNGFSSFNPESKEIKNYTRLNGRLIGGFATKGGIISNRGEIILGGINGLRIFNKHDLVENKNIPPVVLTNFKIFSDSVDVHGADGILKNGINYTDAIELDYKKIMFEVGFSALNFRDSTKNKYAYKLEGFDKDWLDASNQRVAKYTNLNPGKYIFKVKGSNNDGIWNDVGKSITIIQLPPPWKTWWAYTLYVLAVTCILLYYVRGQQIKIARERAINSQLRYIDKLKDNFLANTSHELRTPLHGIIGLSTSLMEGAAGEISKDMKDNLQMIATSGKRLANLVNEILDFSRLKNKIVKIQQKPLNLRHVVDTVTTMSRPLLENKEIDLTNTVDELLPAIYADEDRLQQILFNLIGNAIKFTESGSIIISAEYNDNKICVHIKDTGIGIEPDMFTKIFESFEQVESHYDRKYGGTGLGLAVTRQLVELHGGEISVQSVIGQGSTFSFCMPSTDQPTLQENINTELITSLKFTGSTDNYESPKSTNESLTQFEDIEITSQKYRSANKIENAQFRILIVDDEPINRQVLNNQLGLQGYQIEEAASGTEALDMLNTRGSYDLILLDVMMPRMSGYEVCSRIRKKFTMHELPVIFLTAKNLISDLVDGFDVGANDFLTKPIAKGELLSRVKTHLQLLDINKNLEDKIRTRTHQVDAANRVLKTLDGIVATINQEVVFEKLLEVLLHEAQHLFPATERAIYWGFNESLDAFQPLVAEGYPIAELQKLKVNKELTLVRIYQESKQLDHDIFLLKPGATTSGSLELMPPIAPQAELILTIQDGPIIIGFLSLINVKSSSAFDNIDLQTLPRFHAHAKSAILKAQLMQELKLKNETLENLSLTDQLTGLRNRHYLVKFLDSDIALALRSHCGQPALARLPEDSNLLFFMLDIDFFKTVNDEHGHSAGDQILVNMKAILETIFRNSDFLIRWGGEEFLIISRFSNRSAAPVVAERLRLAVENFEFTLNSGLVIKKTCSIGFASFPFLVSDPLALGWMQVVDIADMCLYAAKKSQRNCWVGIESNPAQEKGMTYHTILTQPERLIEENKLQLHTSIPSDKLIKW
jgi:two-component system, sensor histidine kinase ChiS